MAVDGVVPNGRVGDDPILLRDPDIAATVLPG
jgi:hypothetical protein